MLSKDAIADVVEVVAPNDFYRPAHQLVYDAILDLYGARRAGRRGHRVRELTRGPAAAGGRAPYLHTLISTVPTAANAGYYAQIVAERAILRRLVDGRVPASSRWATTPPAAQAASSAASTTSSTGPRPRSMRSPSGAPARTTSTSSRCCRARWTRSTDLGHRRDRHRHPDRLPAAGRDHQWPAPRTDDHRRRPAGVRQVDVGVGLRAVGRGQAPQADGRSSPWRWASSRS